LIVSFQENNAMTTIITQTLHQNNHKNTMIGKTTNERIFFFGSKSRFCLTWNEVCFFFVHPLTAHCRYHEKNLSLIFTLHSLINRKNKTLSYIVGLRWFIEEIFEINVSNCVE
jgi:hypothetical protein